MNRKIVYALGAIIGAGVEVGYAAELEEIIVTAQKREESFLDVPVALSVLDSGNLAASGITNVEDIFQIAPSVSYQGGVSSSGRGMLIRGVGGGAFASGFEGSVGAMIDGVVTGPGGASLVNFWDVSRIEVLRGPQGTLFGKNTSAGAINMVTNDPTPEYHSEVKLRYGEEYEDTRIEAVINGSLSENVNARLAAFWQEQGEGYIDNVTRGETENKKDGNWGVRLKTTYDSDNFASKLSLTYEETDSNCCVRTFTNIDTDSAGALTNIFLIPSLAAAGLSLDDENRTNLADDTIYDESDTLQIALEMSWELAGGHTIKSISGYRDWQQEEFNDVDFLPIDIINGFVSHDLKLFTQELQLLSPTGGDLDYVVGLYYYQHEIDELTILDGGVDVTGVFGSTSWSNTAEVQNAAIFGHVNYKLSDQWTVYAGARLLTEEIEADGIREGDFFAFPGNFPRMSAKADDNEFMGTVGVKFYPSENVMYYSALSTGYKGSAIDTTIGSSFYTDPNGTSVLKPESVVNFEIGMKASFMEERLVVAGNLFYSVFDDFQATAFDGNSSSFVLRNAGTVESQGIELDAIARPWEGGTITLGMSFVDAIFDEYKGAPCSIPLSAAGLCSDAAGGQDLSGEEVNLSARMQYNLVLNQDFSVAELPLYARAQWSWRDDVTYDGDLDPNTKQDAYGIANFSLGWLHERFEVSLFVQNAFDEEYSYRVIDAPLFSGAYASYQAPGRTFGLEFTFKHQ